MNGESLTNTASRLFYLYLVPLLILTGLFHALRWIPVQMTLEWLLPLAAAYLPAQIPPLQIILGAGLLVGGAFALTILALTRSLHRRVISQRRLRRLEDQRRRGHDHIAASVFDPTAIALCEGEEPIAGSDERGALETDPRLAILITTLWGKNELCNFIQRLLKADVGDGSALTPEMRHELMFLRNLYLDQRGTVSRERPALAVVRPPLARPSRPQRRHRGLGMVLMLSLMALPIV